MTVENQFKLVVSIAAAIAGLAFLASGALADQHWIQHHFLPDFSMSPFARSVRVVAGRTLTAAAAASLFALARLIYRLKPGELCGFLAGAGRITAAVLLALIASEVILSTVFWRPFDQLKTGEEPSRHYDARLGWVNDPSRTGLLDIAGRRITYVIDRDSDRVAGTGGEADKSQPVILFTGESIVFGYKLPWEETIPAQVAGFTGVQAVNLAVEAYSDAQAYTRLMARIGEYQRPVAVVSIFMPSIFKKTLDRTRPGLDASLRPVPAERRLRLSILAHWLFPYESSAAITDGVTTARTIIRATAALARSRGAVPLTLVPRQLPESAMEREIRARVLDQAGLPYILVDLPAEWHVPGDPHPDQRGDRAMAEAIVRALRTAAPEGLSAGNP